MYVDDEGWCPQHGWREPKVEHSGGKFYYVCPICRDYLLPYPDTKDLKCRNDDEGIRDAGE